MNKTTVLNLFRNVFKIRVLESWLMRQIFNRSADSFLSKLAPNPYQYKSPSFRRFKRNGVTLDVDVSDYLGHLTYFGFFDPSMKKLYGLCKPGQNVLDIGTNIGATLLTLAQLSTPGQVIGFEPDPYNYDQCKKNIGLNNFKNVKVLPYGLGEAAATVKMEMRDAGNKSGNRIIVETQKPSISVQIKKLDDVTELNTLSIGLVKIDVEGYELKVLKGAKNLLLKNRPTLFIEVDDENLIDQGDSAKQLLLFLNELGYSKITNAATGLAVTTELDLANCHFDIIAINER